MVLFPTLPPRPRWSFLPFLALLLLAAVLGGGAAQAAEPAPLTVFAASSLTEVLSAFGRDFERQRPVQRRAALRFSFAASSQLARQIAAGAEAHVFVAADNDWMDFLERREQLAPGSRQLLIGNRLVLVAPRASGLRLRIAPGMPLLGALEGGRLAMADPDAVPAGRYSRAALQSLGVWRAIEPRVVRADNVRGALQFVALAATPLGIVYRSDAAAETRVRLIDTFPATSHPPIRYPIARTRHAHPDAAAFVAWLAAPTQRAAFLRRGFALP